MPPLRCTRPVVSRAVDGGAGPVGPHLLGRVVPAEFGNITRRVLFAVALAGALWIAARVAVAYMTGALP